MDKDTADRLRSMTRRVTLKNVRDDGETQRASVEVAEGIWRDDVEILQPAGFAGAPGDLVVLPPSNPSKRMGAMPQGAAGIYSSAGDKLVINPDGTAVLHVAGALRVEAQTILLKAGGVTVTISGGGVAIEGGTVTHNGKNIGDTHVHTNVEPGGGLSGAPQ